MIVPLKKVVCLCRHKDQKKLLRLLRKNSMVHLISKNATHVFPGNQLEEKRKNNLQAISIAKKQSSPIVGPHMHPDDVAKRLVEVESELEGLKQKVADVQFQLHKQQWFGKLCADDFEQIEQKQKFISFWLCKQKLVERLEPKPLVVLKGPTHGSQSVVVMTQPLIEKWKKELTPVEFPLHRTTVLKQKELALKAQQETLQHEQKQLAFHLPALLKRDCSVMDMLRWQHAMNDGFKNDHLFVVQGWVAKSHQKELQAFLNTASIDVAVTFFNVSVQDAPPTLWKPPPLARPITGLFQILGTTPGYTEYDVSLGFMIALPVFCALLIADGGYGLLLLLISMAAYKGMKTTLGKEISKLMMVIGATALVWGFFTASFFGFGIEQLSTGDGWTADVGQFFDEIRIFKGDLASAQVVNEMIEISFVLGAVHMTIARLWRSWRMLPSLEAAAHFGWAIFVWGMLLVANTLVLGVPMNDLGIPLLSVGTVLIVLFSKSDKNILKRVALGIAGLPLGALGVLSDTISYIRLMAVGLASTILGSTFNFLAAEVSSVSSVAGVLVFVLGHSLNIALALIALFAHGVRLNMLEFSNHLGMGWTGYRFEPFCFVKKED